MEENIFNDTSSLEVLYVNYSILFTTQKSVRIFLGSQKQGEHSVLVFAILHLKEVLKVGSSIDFTVLQIESSEIYLSGVTVF